MRITRCRDMGYKRQARHAPQSFRSSMERQATQPAAVPTGRKRRRVSSSKKPKGDKEDMKATREHEMTLIGLPRAEAEEAQALAIDRKATQTPTSELVWALNAIPRADPPPTPSPHRLTRFLCERLDGGHPERVWGRVSRGRDGSGGACPRRPGPRSDGDPVERALVWNVPLSSSSNPPMR